MLMTRHSSNGQLISVQLLQALMFLLIFNAAIATFNYPHDYLNCEDPGIPDNGYSLEGNDNYSVDATVQFGCNLDHVLYGSKSITCTRGMYEAYWSDDVPTCIPIAESTGSTKRTRSSKCSGKAPDPGPHAVELPSSNSTIIEYECHDKEEHVEVSGDKVVYCYNKKWVGEPLECRRKERCPQQHPNQYIIHQQSGELEEDIVLFTCEKGYVLVGASHVTCLSTGQWSNEWPSCEPVSCPYPTNVPYGQVRLNSNSEAEYRCYKGYNLEGNNKVWCTGSGTWSPGVPECQPVDCGDPPALSNGYIQYPATTFNHRAYYTCQSGYTRHGSFSRRCTNDGVWYGNEPTCEAPFVCGVLTNPVGGQVVMSSSTVSSVATYNCDRDKTLIGSVTRTCQTDGTWSGEEPQCIIVTDCGEPVSITNGDVSYSSTIVDSLATYSCNNGYTLVGDSDTVKCNNNGEWEKPLPACAAIDCGPPPSIQNGQATFSSTNFKSVATYTCNKGHSINGDRNSIICEANGKWQEALTTCVEINCMDPPIISNGVPYYNSTLFLSEVTYTCLAGYILTGSSSSLVCQANSEWFGEQPTCEAINCGEPVSITNGDVSYSSTIVDSLATYSCNNGYTLVGDSDTVKCTNSGEWEGSIPACIVDCGLLDLPNNTIISYPDNSTLINSVANYSCQPGYVLSTDSIRTCSENGTWTEPEPVCQPIDCGTLPSFDNGVIRYSVTTTLASFVRYSCNIGFMIVGMDIRICLTNGTWSGVSPTCQMIDCNDLDNPENGVVQFNATTFTSRALYSCDRGYMITPGDDRQRFCRIDGMWGGVEPTCELINCGELTSPANGDVEVSSALLGGVANYTCINGYHVTEPDTRTCGDDGNWSGEEPSCHIVDCGDPGILIDGQRTYFGTTYRQVATFVCNSDFTMIGDGLRRCEANGEWTSQVPTCSANVPTCGIPGSPKNGYAILQATIPGSVVEYGCIDGFELSGSKIRTCGNDQQWTDSVPNCRRITRCPNLETPAFSRRVGDSNEFNSVAYFICEDDYDTVGSNARVCQNNTKWSGTQPMCVLRSTSCNDSDSVRDQRGRLCECIDGELASCHRYRQDWLALSTAEKTRYTQTVLEASSNELYKPFYQTLMQLYRDGSGTLALSLASNTQFFPWHRYFLQQYEDLLRLINPSVSLPFWDWTQFPTDPYVNPIFSPETGFGNSSDSDNCVQEGPFRKNELFLSPASNGGCLERLYGQGFLLSREQLADFIDTNVFSSFFTSLTVPYISIRCAVGGTMCAVNAAVATDDPLQILILTYLDSIWDNWQNRSIDHKLARYGNDNTPLVLTTGVTAANYHDNSNLPHGLSVRYGVPVDYIPGGNTVNKRSVEEMTYLSEDTMDRLSLSDQDRSTIRAAYRLLYNNLTH